MDLIQLRYFLTAAKHEHITQAARELNLTQPALSKVVARLEDDLGVELFDRKGKSIYLNDNGRIVRKYAAMILQSIDEMHAELLDSGNGVTGRIRIGTAFPNDEPPMVHQCLHEFCRQYPNVTLSLRQLSVNQLSSALYSNDIDLAISPLPLNAPEFHWEELFYEQMGILIAEDHPLADEGSIFLSELKDEHFLCINANSDAEDLTYRFCRWAGFQPKIYFEGDFSSFISSAVGRGAGISFISENVFYHKHLKDVDVIKRDNVAFRRIKEDFCKRYCGIAYMKDRYMCRAVRNLHELIVDSYRHPSDLQQQEWDVTGLVVLLDRID